MRLKAIYFAANSSYVGNQRLEFKSHLDRLDSSLPQYFGGNAYQPAVKDKDDGVRLVKSRGLAFVPCVTAEIALNQGPLASITKVISCVLTDLGLKYCAYKPALNWMQASFTAWAERTYISHIRTRHEPHQVEFTARSYRGNARTSSPPSWVTSFLIPVRAQTKSRRGKRVLQGQTRARPRGVQKRTRSQE